MTCPHTSSKERKRKNERESRKDDENSLLWLTTGFSATDAAFAQFVWKEIWTDRYAICADTQQKFDALEARVLNIESNLSQLE
ncbi:hypothetical protein LWI29_013339 [Acer saccharum]|uniref:Uncharacterized protein n=1 Tax=Acer saccharum TaxID=4024 RepID=A0AA39RCF3_ACESA|nr:hypothetical protein LWI29_013339 [Acer saccharum]